MSWLTIRKALAGFLEQLEIAEPVQKKIVRVYEKPPAQIQDTPCIIIYPTPFTTERGPGARKEMTYSAPLVVLVSGEAIDEIVDTVEAFADAMTNLFDEHYMLGNPLPGVTLNVAGEDKGRPGNVTVAEKPYAGFEWTVRIHSVGPKEFRP